jgi:hypothetical protein
MRRLRLLRDMSGKTIRSVTKMKREFDPSESWLKFEFMDGTECFVVGYRPTCGECRENGRPTYIGINPQPPDDLVAN